MSYIGADIRSEKASRDYDRSDKDNYEDRSKKFHRKKICKFCSDIEYVLDYKDARMMQSFVSEHGKIVPRRISGNCALHQRQITTAVKRARILALVGYVSSGV
jgi:small subunit ribosomal protein S18